MIDDSRLTFRKISNDLGVSTDTVIRRYKKLKKRGVFKPIINVDIFKLGYSARVWYMISLMPQINLSSTIDKVAKIEDVIRIIKAVGDYDLLVIAAVKGFKHMYTIGEKLIKIPGVTKIEGRPYLPSNDSTLSTSAASGFFNPNLLKTE